jgi:hypothetical protein
VLACVGVASALFGVLLVVDSVGTKRIESDVVVQGRRNHVLLGRGGGNASQKPSRNDFLRPTRREEQPGGTTGLAFAGWLQSAHPP